MSEIDALTGTPNSDDVLEYAVGVCAPYNVLSGFKFRMKLIPGTGKKGKSTQHAKQYNPAMLSRV